MCYVNIVVFFNLVYVYVYVVISRHRGFFNLVYTQIVFCDIVKKRDSKSWAILYAGGDLSCTRTSRWLKEAIDRARILSDTWVNRAIARFSRVSAIFYNFPTCSISSISTSIECFNFCRGEFSTKFQSTSFALESWWAQQTKNWH